MISYDIGHVPQAREVFVVEDAGHDGLCRRWNSGRKVVARVFGVGGTGPLSRSAQHNALAVITDLITDTTNPGDLLLALHLAAVNPESLDGPVFGDALQEAIADLGDTPGFHIAYPDLAGTELVKQIAQTLRDCGPTS